MSKNSHIWGFFIFQATRNRPKFETWSNPPTWKISKKSHFLHIFHFSKKLCLRPIRALRKWPRTQKIGKNDIFLTFSRWVCGSLLKVQLVCFGFMATSGDVVEVYIVNSTKFQILPDFGWPEIWKNPKYQNFSTFSRWVCGSLLKVQLVCFGFMATLGDVLEKYVVNLTIVSNFAQFRVAWNMKNPQIWEFFDIFQAGMWVPLEGSVDLFWVYGNLRGCSRGICS